MISIIICSRGATYCENVKANIKRTIGVTFEIIIVDNSDNKLAFLPIAIVWLILGYKFYASKVEYLISKFKNEKKYNFYIILLFSIFIPLYILIKLSGGSIWR